MRDGGGGVGERRATTVWVLLRARTQVRTTAFLTQRRGNAAASLRCRRSTDRALAAAAPAVLSYCSATYTHGAEGGGASWLASVGGAPCVPVATAEGEVGVQAGGRHGVAALLS